MRLYLAPIIGTGLSSTFDLDPADYYWLDDIVGGTLVTYGISDDAIRPDAPGIVAPYTCTIITRPRPSAIDRYLVLDSGDMPVPTGCVNISVPGNISNMNTPMGTPQRNALEDFLGQPRRTFREAGTNFTPRRFLRWCVGPGWRQKVGLFELRSDEPT